ncbi:MAG TPA: hypothetical protein VHB97_24970 [Polyangia bacterium]|jgi:hypothetical protein|nr:hypothetical protein [Polyangia bacterium]
MSFTRPTRLAFALLALTAGCATGNYTRSVNGTVGGYSMRNVHPTPPSLMVARKIQRPLYIVVDASKVKDTWPIDTASCATGASGCEHFKLMDFQEFVRRDLRSAMTNYFSRVEVVDSPDALPKTPHVVADVKVDNIRLNALVRGPLTYELIEMTWGFALRGSDQQEYAYSFAGTATSNDSYPTFEAGCAQLVEDAIPAMLKKWTESGGIEALRDSKK